MKIVIQFNTDGDAFIGDDDWDADLVDTFYNEVGNVLEQAREKIMRQRHRAEGCVCDALEADDKLLDSNGNTVGTVRLEETK